MLSFSGMRASAREALKGRWNESALASLLVFAVTFVMLAVNAYIAGTGISIWSEFTNSTIVLLISVLLIVPLAWGLIVAMWHIVQGNEEQAIKLMGDSFKQDWSFAVKFTLYILVLAAVYYFAFALLLAIGTIIWVSQSGFTIDPVYLQSLSEPEIVVFLVEEAPSLIILIGALYVLFIGFLVRLELMFSMTYFVHIDQPELPIWDAMKESRRLMNGHKWELFCLQLTFIGWYFLSILTLGIGFIWLIPYAYATTAVFYEELRAEDIGNQEEIANEEVFVSIQNNAHV